MTIDDLFKLGLPAMLFGLFVIVAFFVKKIIEAVEQLETDAQSCSLRHEQFRSHVSENYAKRAEVQHSLDRIHSRLDSLPGEIVRNIRGEK